MKGGLSRCGRRSKHFRTHSETGSVYLTCDIAAPKVSYLQALSSSIFLTMHLLTPPSFSPNSHFSLRIEIPCASCNNEEKTRENNLAACVHASALHWQISFFLSSRFFLDFLLFSSSFSFLLLNRFFMNFLSCDLFSLLRFFKYHCS